MKIFNLNNNIFFGKKLLASASVLDSCGEPRDCKVYFLNSQNDIRYFDKLKNESDWKYSCFLKTFQKNVRFLANNDEKHQLIVMENESGDCLACAELLNNDDNSVELMFLETAPKYTNYDKSRNAKLRYIGETMLGYIVKYAQKNKKDLVYLLSLENAISFYKNKCKFRPLLSDRPLYCIENSDYDTFIKQNENHTKGKIELI